MGFLTSLLRIAAPIAGAFLGVQAAAPAAAPAQVTGPTIPAGTTPTAKTAVRSRPGLLTQLGQAVTGGATSIALPGTAIGAAVEQAVVSPAGLGCPTGKNRIRTIVQTILPNGQVCEQKVLEGRPFLMRKDFVTAKRVRKLIQGAKTKIIPTRREESEQTKLVKAVVTTATRNVLTGGGSSHGNG